MSRDKPETKSTPAPDTKGTKTTSDKIIKLINLIKGAAANAKSAEKKDIVLVIGPTGAGKSTLINCLLGKVLVSPEGETGDREFAPKNVKDGISGPKIGHAGSCTTYPEVFVNKGGLAFCDTAGFFDTRGKEHSQSAYYALHVAVSVARSLKGILFVCDLATMQSMRGNFFIQAVKLLTTILHTNKEYGRSVFFMITKTGDKSHKYILGQIKKLRTILEGDGEDLAATLLKILEDKPDTIIPVNAEQLTEEEGIEFAEKINNRLKGAQIRAEDFSVGGGDTGKEEYLEAYQHLIGSALNQIQVLTWKMDDLKDAEREISTITENITNNTKLIAITEEKLQGTRKGLEEKKIENDRLLVNLNARLRAIPDEVAQLEENELKGIEDTETERHRRFIADIDVQHEANLRVTQEGAAVRIRNLEEENRRKQQENVAANQAVEQKNRDIDGLRVEVRRLTEGNAATNHNLNDELARSRAYAEQQIAALQREGNYETFPLISEVKVQLDNTRAAVVALDREIQAIENERQGYLSRITTLKNDGADYLIHTSSRWSEQAVYGTVLKGVVHHFDYNYNGSADIKRHTYSAVISAPEGTPGSVTDEFIRGRECGGKYHTPSHVYGSFTHYVYLSKKDSPENIAEAARLQTLCEGLVARKTERETRRANLLREVERLQTELNNRKNDEERRIREQAEANRLAIENRREIARRDFEATRDDRNQRIQALEREIAALQADIANRTGNIQANAATILEIGQNGRVDEARSIEQRQVRIREAERRKDETIAQRQAASRERLRREKEEKLANTNREIQTQTESGQRIQEAGEKLIVTLETDLERRRKTAQDYEVALRQSKERRVVLLGDIENTHREFMNLMSSYDAIVDLFGLLKLSESYSQFINSYKSFTKGLLLKVAELLGSKKDFPDFRPSAKPGDFVPPPEFKTRPDTAEQKANDLFISQLIRNEALLRAMFYERAQGVRDLDEKDTFYDTQFVETRTCYMNTLQRQVILVHQLHKQNMAYRFVEDKQYFNHVLDCGENGRILLPELRIEFKDGRISDNTKRQLEFILNTHLSRGSSDRPLFIPIHLPGHFTLLGIEKRDNKVFYRYVDSLHDFNFERGQDPDRTIKNDFVDVIQRCAGGPPQEITVFYVKQQRNKTGMHYNECGQHVDFGILWMLKKGLSADFALMRAGLNLPGTNVTANGGLDPDDALSIIPTYQSLFKALNEQVKASAKTSKGTGASASASPFGVFGTRTSSPEPGEPTASAFTFEARQ